MNPCSCPEAWIKTKDGPRRNKAAQRHNCKYVRIRTALIPQAEALATSQVGSRKRNPEWDRVFISAMDSLTKKRFTEV